MSVSTTISLPTSRTFLTALLSALPSAHRLLENATKEAADANTPPTLSISQKPALLTLHALFPTLLLPALDLLDRHLVTRLVLRDQVANNGAEYTDGLGANRTQDGWESKGRRPRVVYYVKSNAQHPKSSKYAKHGNPAEVNYEVRTQAWNCSCAAFAYAAFNGSAGWTPDYQSYDGYGGCGNEDEDEEMLDAPEQGGRGDGQSQWGGLMLGEEVPLCKHLLACVLGERWDVAEGMIEETQVGREELAGWAAGWGG